jgi:hypothetical protein
VQRSASALSKTIPDLNLVPGGVTAANLFFEVARQINPGNFNGESERISGNSLAQILESENSGGTAGGLTFVFNPQTQPPTDENHEFRLNNADPDIADKLYLGQLDKAGAPIAGIVSGSKRALIYLKSDNPDFYALGKLGKIEFFLNYLEIDINLILFSQAAFPTGQSIYLNLYPNQEAIVQILDSNAIVTPDLNVSNYFVLAPTQNFVLELAQNLSPGEEFKIKIYGGQTMTLAAGYKIPATGYTRSTDPAKYDVFHFVSFDFDEATLVGFSGGY